MTSVGVVWVSLLNITIHPLFFRPLAIKLYRVVQAIYIYISKIKAENKCKNPTTYCMTSVRLLLVITLLTRAQIKTKELHDRTGRKKNENLAD